MSVSGVSGQNAGRRSGRVVIALLAWLCALLALAGSVLIVARASAAWVDVTETGRPGYLSLRSDPGTPHWSNLRPGDTAHWLIEASLADADEASLRLELDAEGPLIEAGRLMVGVNGCSMPFVRTETDPHCEGRAETVLEETSLAAVVTDAAADTYPLTDLRRSSPRYILVRLEVAPSAVPDTMAGSTARIGLGLHAEGGDAEGDLATTGSDANDLMPVVMLAAGLFGLGGCVALSRRSKRAGRHEDA